MSSYLDGYDIDTDACQAEIEAELGELIEASNRAHRGWQDLWDDVAAQPPAQRMAMRRLA
jgi:hypothetical protein